MVWIPVESERTLIRKKSYEWWERFKEFRRRVKGPNPMDLGHREREREREREWSRPFRK